MTNENKCCINNDELNECTRSRWDNLSRKYSASSEVSEVVKKFLDLDFVNNENMAKMQAEKNPILNPLIVMEMRHSQDSHRKREGSSYSKNYKEYQKENAINHNKFVELRMIENEISKYKSKIKQFSTKKPKKLIYNDCSDDQDSDEEAQLLRIIQESRKMEKEYRETFSSNSPSDEISKAELDCYLDEYISNSAITGNSSSSDNGFEDMNNKMVHFEDIIKVTTYPKTPNTLLSIDGSSPIEPEIVDHDFDYYSSDLRNELNQELMNQELQAMEKNMKNLMRQNCSEIDYLDQYEKDFEDFRSLPDLSDADVGDFMKITQFQSMHNIQTQKTVYEKGTNCNFSMEYSQNLSITKVESNELVKAPIENTEAEKLMIVKRIEIEEKNYSQLIIMNYRPSSTYAELSNDRGYVDKLESQKIIHDLVVDRPDSATEHDKQILKTYFQRWLNFTTIEKIVNTNAFTNEDRVKKINNFLNKVRIEQNKSTHKMSTVPQSAKSLLKKPEAKRFKRDYEHKLKIQQDIIDLQKLKLQRQERLITEMKLAKFSEMLKESRCDLKTELRNVASRGNIKLRSKAKCIQIIGNIKPDQEDENKRKLMAQGLIVPKFLSRMQARAEERAVKHFLARERRIRLEEDKEKLKTAAEIAKRQVDDDVKRKRIEELREKRRKEKVMKLLKERERHQYKENMKKSNDFYVHKLLNYGMKGFHDLIIQKRTNHKKALIHRRKMIMQTYYRNWQLNAKKVWDLKRMKADRHFQITMLKHYFAIWSHVHQIIRCKLLVAIDWYEVRITEKILKIWVEQTKCSKMIENTKLRKAESHFHCQLKWSIFDHWRRLPALMRIEKETEVRKQRWRLKIWDTLPDYKPAAS